MAEIQLSEHFTYKKLIRFTLPSVVMMIFTSIYCVVDGIFVSNFVGKTPFAALNLIMPFLQMLGVVGFMLGTGGSALVAKVLGEGNRERANSLFSMLVYLLTTMGIVLALVGVVCVPLVAEWLGAEGTMLDYCVRYANILLISLPMFVLQYAFQSFWVTAEKPAMGLKVTVIAGLANIVLDYVFIVVFRWGLEGAAYATAISQCVGGVIPLVYFGQKNSSLLKLTCFRYDGKALMRACTNGSSEMVTNLSLSLVCMLYNFQLMKYIGENGVAAYGVIMYTYFIFLSVFIGYAIGTSPIVSFHYGAKNSGELKSVLRKSVLLLSLMGLFVTLLAVALACPLSQVFVGYDEELYALTYRAFVLYSLSFLVVGLNIYSSAFFTALNNGFVSAFLSFTRIFVFECGAVLLLPLVMGLDGIWVSIVVAQLLGIVVAIAMFLCYRRRYGY